MTTIVARICYEPLRLATVNFPENFTEVPTAAVKNIEPDEVMDRVSAVSS
jgi:hypothetical protein